MYLYSLKILLFVGALFAITGCGEDKTPPRVISKSPDNGFIGVSPNGINFSTASGSSQGIGVQFNERIRESAIDTDAITLMQDGQTVTGKINLLDDLNLLVFVPDDRLIFLKEYDVTLKSGISDMKGNRTKIDQDWTFTIRDIAPVSAPIIISTIPVAPAVIGNAQSPQIAVDADGNAIAVWAQSDDAETTPRINIWANRFTLSSESWGTPILIESNDSGNASSPQIAFDPDGNDAIAVWSQFDSTQNRIYANRFDGTASTWNTAVPIDNNSNDAAEPQIAIDASGNAIAVWIESDDRVYASRFASSTSTWGTAVPIDSDTGIPTAAQIAIDANDDAIAVWAQFNRIYAARYTGGWNPAALIDDGNGTATAVPQLAIDPDGTDAFAVWSQSDGTQTSIWANKYNGTTWGSAELIETDNIGNANTPQIAVDPAGNAIAVWSQSDGTRFRAYANRFTTAGLWGTPVLIEASITGNSTEPQISIDNEGNTLAVWTFEDTLTINNIVANRFTPADGWKTAGTLENNNSQATSPQAAIAPDRSALAVWSQPQSSSGTRVDIQALRFN